MVSEIADDIWWYDLSGVNAYLVDDGGTLTLIDAGMPWHGNTIVGGLQTAGFDLHDLDRILLTHYDMDHVGGLSSFDAVDLTITVGSADAPFVTGERSPPLGSVKGGIQRFGSKLVDPPHNLVETIADGETIGSFTAYHTPGHSPGHMAYVSPELDVAFVGDCVHESEGKFEPSEWYLSTNNSEVPVSIRRLSHRTGEFDIAAPGHGVPFTKGGSDRLAELADSLR